MSIKSKFMKWVSSNHNKGKRVRARKQGQWRGSSGQFGIYTSTFPHSGGGWTLVVSIGSSSIDHFQESGTGCLNSILFVFYSAGNITLELPDVINMLLLLAISIRCQAREYCFLNVKRFF